MIASGRMSSPSGRDGPAVDWVHPWVGPGSRTAPWWTIGLVYRDVQWPSDPSIGWLLSGVWPTLWSLMALRW